MRTGVAADAREVVFEDTVREELVSHLRHDETPWAVLAGEAIVVDCSQPMTIQTGYIDNTRVRVIIVIRR